MSDKEKETARQHYLQNFRNENSISDLFSRNSIKIGKEIVEQMKKEDLTHDEAYASLQYAYNLIKYESNFLKLN